MKYINDLTPEQNSAIDFILAGEDSLIAADVGTGKTAIALTAALQEHDVKRWLVLAPLLVATDTWAKEPSEWAHIPDEAVAIACGTEPERLSAINSGAKIVVLNYENLDWLMKQFPRKGRKDPLPFDGLICDEIDKLKSVSSNRFKAFRNRVGKFSKRIGLTGTLIPNDLLELWGQVYMVDGGESFGRSYYKWREKYFYPTDYNQYNWRPFERSRDELIRSVADLTFRIRAKGLPELHIEEPTLLTMPETSRTMYYELEKEYFLEIEEADAAVDAANAGILAGKLNQLCSGFLYTENKGKRETIWLDEVKFLWLSDLYNKICNEQGEQLLIFYHYAAELEMMDRSIAHFEAIKTGQSIKKKRALIDQWNNGDLPALALHPQAAGHGLNLQHSGAHNIAFTTLPWSGGLFRQSVGRLARRGNEAREVFVHSAIYDNTIDQQIYQVLSGRLSAMDSFLNDLESQIGSAS